MKYDIASKDSSTINKVNDVKKGPLLLMFLFSSCAIAENVEFCAVDNFGNQSACMLTMTSCQNWIKNLPAGSSCQPRRQTESNTRNEFCAVDNFGNKGACMMTMDSCREWIKNLPNGTTCQAYQKQ